MRIVHWSLPLSSLRLLCIQELLLRSWRRPINRRSPLELSDPLSDEGDEGWRARRPRSQSSSFAFTRSTSLTSTSGASSMRLSAVRNRRGKQELNGPRSIPCAASLSFRKVKPLEKGFTPAPYGPNRKPKSKILSG